MTESMIERLRRRTPEERAELMEMVYAKNMEFFKDHHPQLFSTVKSVECPYSFKMTEDFVDIIDSKTNQSVLPGGGLDRFAEMLGDWTHDAWVDLFNFRVVSPEQYPIHHQPIKKFARELMVNFPEYSIRFAQRKINLKEVGTEKRFSPPTIFLGLFHGLHIDYYLSRTELAYLLFVEPDVHRFEVSCYFLDYAAMQKKFGTFLLAVGDSVESHPIRLFFSNYHPSRHMWTRVLPGYETEKNAMFIESFKTLQTTLASIIFPIDHEIVGLEQVEKNTINNLPVLSSTVKLSRKAKIAIVAMGPSLNNDLAWLKKNQEKLIICAVQSAVKLLLANGIKPDFQFSLETNMDEERFRMLEMPKEIPAVLFYKAPSLFTEYFQNVLLCPVQDRACPVRFKKQLDFAAPSTTNLALAFSLYSRPKTIFLLGCDFGYVNLEQTHASGGIYGSSEEEQDEGKLHTYLDEMSQALVEGNFPETKFIQTTPFLSHARLSVEQAIESSGKGIEVINVSDGAKVKGTVPARSNKIRLKKYPSKNDDINKLQSMFKEARKGVNYEPFTLSGYELVEKFKAEFIKNLRIEPFSWVGFNKVVDFGLENAIESCREDDSDKRLYIFVRFFVDILSSWYSTLIFYDDVEKAEEVYQFGLKKIEKIIEETRWPLDEIY